MTMRRLFPIAAGVLLLPLAWALLQLPASSEGLAGPSSEALPLSGVDSLVTAVLLNFRAYDTLLELGVLLLAVVAIWSQRIEVFEPVDISERPLLLPFLRLVLPVLIVVAGYLLWLGSTKPGGAFQGGAMMGGALVLATSAGLLRRLAHYQLVIRVGLVLGLSTFLLAALVTLTATGFLLFYREDSAQVWILTIEAGAFISIGLTLGALYLGGRPEEAEGKESRHD